MVAAGPGRYTDTGALIPCCVKPGDRVMMTKYVGSSIELDGETFTVVGDQEAILVLTEDANIEIGKPLTQITGADPLM